MARRSLDDLRQDTITRCNVTLEELTGPRRCDFYVFARRDFARRARAEGYMLIDIGRALGGRTPSTILRLVNHKTP